MSHTKFYKAVCIFTATLTFCAVSASAAEVVPPRISDYVESYFAEFCEVSDFDENDISTLTADKFYEESEDGYFYEFSNSYNIFYKGESIGHADNWGEGAESFGGTDEWNFELSCPQLLP